MTSNSQAFLRDLGAAVAAQLVPVFTYSRSKLELKRKVPEGHDVITLSGSAKYSPFINVSFFYGKNFATARALEKAARAYAFPCHIQQFSLNWRPGHGKAYQGDGSWSIDLSNPPTDLAREMASAIQGIAFPFFSRFSSPRAARNALAANDPSCFGGPAFWSQLLRLDAVLSELHHFQRWSQCLDEWTRDQAEAEMSKFAGATAGGVQQSFKRTP